MRRISTWFFLLGITVQPAAVAAQESALRPFVRGTWQQIRQTHAVRPLIVHFWGLTCGPCRIELPEWGKLLDQQTSVDVVVIHAERMPGDPALVTEMLKSAGLSQAENWLFSESYQEPLRFEIDPRWQGELPRTMLIARDGQITTVTGSADLSQVRAWIATQSR